MASGARKPEDLPAVLKPSQAASFLGLGRNTIYDAIRRGDIYAIRIGGRLVIPTDRLLRDWPKEEAS
jgi:excisionase family DNA binding protein